MTGPAGKARHRQAIAVAVAVALAVALAGVGIVAVRVTARPSAAPGGGGASQPLPAPRRGFWALTASGAVRPSGGASPLEPGPPSSDATPTVAIAGLGTADRYALVHADGEITVGGQVLVDVPLRTSSEPPVIGAVLAAEGDRGWEFAADGAVTAFGGAGQFGSPPSGSLTSPVVAMAATTDHLGYWEITRDGTLYGFGEAAGPGAVPGQPTVIRERWRSPVVGMIVAPGASDPMVATADGIVHDLGLLASDWYGDGSPGVSGIAGTPDGLGYVLIGADGALEGFGDAGDYGVGAGADVGQPVLGLAFAAVQPDPVPVAYGPGADQHGMLYRPTEAIGPLVVMVHGGWFAGGPGWSEPALPEEAIHLQERGATVLAADYRRSGPAIPGTPAFPGQVEDVATAAGWLQRDAAGRGRPGSRTVLMGGSAGATLAGLAAGCLQSGCSGVDPTRATLRVIALSAVSDLSTLLDDYPGGPSSPGALAASYFLATALQCAPITACGHLLVESSLVAHLTRGVPWLVGHSTGDPSIPFAQSKELVDRLGSEASLVAVPGVGHSFTIAPAMQGEIDAFVLGP